jgi:seryl-tRNA synthetase
MHDLKQLRNQRKKMTEEIVKTQDKALIDQSKALKVTIQQMEETVEKMETDLDEEASKLPNTSHESVPMEDTVVFQSPDINQDEIALDHTEVCKRLDLCDFESAAEISGSKFYYLKNEAVMLELALLNYVTNVLRGKGFVLHTTPELVRKQIVQGCGFQARGEHTQIYSIENSDLCLIGTSEIPLAGLYMNKLIPNTKLPIRVAGVSHCFRTEAGAPGLKDKGLYRVHQFTKVEMFVFARQEESNSEFLKLVEIQREICDSLGLQYRVLNMAHHELGSSANRKYDFEAWMKGKKSFGEISSTSNCTDYQARRLNIKYQMSENLFMHTLNGTGLAVPRVIMTILENNQYYNEQGKLCIRIPKVLGMSDLVEK